MHHRSRALCSLLGAATAAALVFIGPASSATATDAQPVRALAPLDADSLTISSFDAELTLGRDADDHSTLEVVETVVADFPTGNENHGIMRSIPLYTGDGVSMQTDLVSVTMDGGDVPYERENDSGFLELTIGDENAYMHGSHTFEIAYTQRDVVQDFPDTASQELYRDINGTGWELPFGSVTTTVRLDDGLEDALTGNAACYAGEEGSTDTCPITVTGSTATATSGPFEPGGNMTIAMGFEQGTFATPPPFRESTAAHIGAWIPAIGAGLLALWLVALRFSAWRNARGRGTIIPQYTPPPGISPLEAALLLRVRKRGFAAQLIQLAVRGVGRIVEDTRQSSSHPTYGFQSTNVDAADSLQPLERSFLHAVLGNNENMVTTWLDKRNTSLGDRLARRRRDADTAITSRGLARKGSLKVSTALRVLAGIAIFGSISVIAVFSTRGGVPGYAWLSVLVTIVVSVLVIIFAKSRYWLTHEGALVHEHLRGLRDYIRLAEADRIRYLQSPQGADRVDTSDGLAIVRLHEKLLPYAILWGLEKEWISQLTREYATSAQPDWFFGNDLASVAVLSSTFTMGSIMTTPSSSGSWSGSGGSSSFGGSTGGGFSGGGSGGGGGGGW